MHVLQDTCFCIVLRFCCVCCLERANSLNLAYYVMLAGFEFFCGLPCAGGTCPLPYFISLWFGVVPASIERECHVSPLAVIVA